MATRLSSSSKKHWKKTLSSIFNNTDSCSTSELHPIWQELNNLLDVTKATLNAKLLKQRYLRTTSHTAGARCSERCPHCSRDAETTSHFVLYYQAIAKVRPYMCQVMSTCHDSSINVEPDNIIRIILDSSNLLPKDDKHEENVRNFIPTPPPLPPRGEAN